MPEPATVTLRDRSGRAFEAPIGDVGSFLERGYSLETPEQHVGRVAEGTHQDIYGGIGGTITAAGLGIARGATLGLTDVVLRGLGAEKSAEGYRDVNPGASIGGELAGILSPVGAGALVGKLGRGISAIGEGAGAVGKIAAATAGAAAEGAIYNAGAYVSDVALGDRDLSAEAFMAAMGKGALWGGAAGGVLSASERGFTALRRLLPKQEVTREAVEHAEDVGYKALADHISDGEALDAEATRRLREIQAEDALFRPPAPSAAPAARMPSQEASLAEQLLGTKQALEGGQGLGALSAEGAGITIPNRVAAEGAAHAELAQRLGPQSEAGRLTQAQADLRRSREMMERWSGKYVPRAGGPLFDEAGRYVPNGAEAISAAAPRATPAEDLVEAMHALADHEQASARLTQDLGFKAPQTAVDHAAELARAVAEHQASIADAAAREASKISEQAAKLPKPPIAAPELASDLGTSIGAANAASVAPPTAAKGSGVLGKLKSAAEGAGMVAEGLHTLGVPGMPDPSNIPIIGPIAKLYLRAKILARVFRRLGGQALETTETAVANKAAETRQRTLAAVDGALEGLGKAAGKAQRAVGPLVILAHQLFENDRGEEKHTTAAQAFAARAEEIANATPPAIAKAIEARVPTHDMALSDALKQVAQRQRDFLDSKLPKPDAIRGLLGGKPFEPTRLEIDTFARYVNGATNPTEVIERACRGERVSAQELEAVKAVYPRLFAEAQVRLVQSIGAWNAKPAAIPYSRKAQLSLMFDLPLTSSMEPAVAAFLQQSFKHSMMPDATSGVGGIVPGTPTIKSDVKLGTRAATRLDRT